MSKIKKLILTLGVAFSMAIAFVVGAVVLKQDKSKPSDETPIATYIPVKHATYQFEVNEVEMCSGTKNINYSYVPDTNAGATSIAYEYVFNNPMGETMAITLKTIGSENVNLSYAYSDTRLTSITSSSSPFAGQTINTHQTKYIYIIVSPSNSMTSAEFQSTITWYQGKAGTMTYTIGNNTITDVVVKGQPITQLNPEIDDSYELTGWYYDEECTQPVTFPIKANVETLYPKVNRKPNLPSDWIKWDSASSSYHMFDPYDRGFSGEVEDIVNNNPGPFTELPEDLVIPAYYDDGIHGRAPVTELPAPFASPDGIGPDSYESVFQSNVRKITIPETITQIRAGTFAYSTITTITLPNTLTEINSHAFACSNLTTINLSECDALTTIGDRAFFASSLGGVVVLPINVVNIGYASFTYANVTEIDLGACRNLTTIEEYVFESCSITTITLPASLTTIEDDAFFDCTNLITIYNGSNLELVAGSSDHGRIALYATNIINYPKVTFMANGGTFEGVEGMEGYVFGTNSEVVVENLNSTYPFTVNANGYWESGNKGVNNSYSLAKVSFYANAGDQVVFTVINYAEANYDYGIFGNLDSTLSSSNTADSSYYKRFYGESSASEKTVTYNITSAGDHYIYVKFRKDSSQHSYNDSLQFKVALVSTVTSYSSAATKVKPNVAIGTMPTPIRSGYTFAGWYTDKNYTTKVTSSSTISEDTTVYAKWE